MGFFCFVLRRIEVKMSGIHLLVSDDANTKDVFVSISCCIRTLVCESLSAQPGFNQGSELNPSCLY